MSIRARLNYYKTILNADMKMQAYFDYKYFETAQDILHTYIGDIAGKVILDVGCGRLCGQALLFNSLGGKVTGIDTTDIVINKPRFIKYWRSLIRNGLEGFGRDVLYTLLGKNKAYYRRLRGLSGFELNPGVLDIRRMSVENMTFPASFFDIVISNNTFEHIANVSQAISEIHRVLKPGGITYIRIHLFTSLSGGHNLDLRDPYKIPPWNHLRSKHYTEPVYLNRLREHEYISLFKVRFEILDIMDGVYWGKDLLTPSIRAELSDYSEEELLKMHITIVARK
jgi:SAM-dependent methyltransferase